MSRRKPSAPTCRDCPATVVWFGDARGAGRRRPFNPRPVPVAERANTDARPVFGNQFWTPARLTEHFMQVRDVSRAEAEQETAAVAWHRTHTCEPTTSTKEA